MRIDPVPCAHATYYELLQGKHFTKEDDCICMRCKEILALFENRRALGEQQAIEYEKEERREAALARSRSRHPASKKKRKNHVDEDE